ncbi:hypothetical protein PG990_004015 [Apiospora arundinis]
MGAYVSVYECESHYNVTINCEHSDYDNETDTYRTIGGHEPGSFPGNPDVAGIGIVGVFVATTCFALFISALDVLWQTLKTCGYKKTRSEVEKLSQPDRVSVSNILQSMVLSCSDQQVFTGAAYALTLRYWQGCTISAYHYNVVANMMLLSCATHLMSVTIVRHYWRYPVLAAIRVACITGVFIVTGLLMVNQNADDRSDLLFPTKIPEANTTTSLLFLPAACFESARSPFAATFRNTTANADAFFLKTLRHSTPGNKLHGWNWYIVLLLFYLVAGAAEIIRCVRRAGEHHTGWRGWTHRRLSRVFKPQSGLRKTASYGYLLYLSAGIGVSSTAMGKSVVYIFGLRNWVDRSGWVEDDNGINPENEWRSFGQLVPIFMTAMVVFAFVQLLSERLTQNRKHKQDEKAAQNGTTVLYNDPSQQYSLLNNNNNIPSDGKADTAYWGASQIASPPVGQSPGAVQLFPSPRASSGSGSGSNTSTPRASRNANSTGSTPQLPGLGLQNTSPLLGHGSSIVSPPQSVMAAATAATPPRPLTSRYSSGYFANAGPSPEAADPVSPPSPTPGATSRPPSGTYVSLAQQERGSSAGGSPGSQLQQQSRGASGGSWSASEERQTSGGSWRSSRGG